MTEEKKVLQPLRTRPFYRNLANILTLCGMGCRSWWGYGAPNIIMIIHTQLVLKFSPICMLSELGYLIVNYKVMPFNKIRLFFVMFYMDIVANTYIRSAQMKTYERIMKLFFNKVHLINYSDDDFGREKAIKAEKYSKITAYFIIIFLTMDWALWYLLPVCTLSEKLDGIRNKTEMLETMPHLLLPYDYKYNILNWSLTHLLSSYIGLVACTVVMISNIINYMFVFHLIGHVQILKHKFRTQFLNPVNDHDTKEKLIDVIKHHCFIVEVFKDTQKAFGYNVTASYCHNLLSDSLLMYEVMLGEKQDIIQYGLLFIALLGGLILMSLILEEIRRESEDIAEVIYSIPWEDMSISNQKTYMMLLARAQPTMEYVSAGGLRAGVRPTISIIKSTFSYYVMLKSSIKVNE